MTARTAHAGPISILLRAACAGHVGKIGLIARGSQLRRSGRTCSGSTGIGRWAMTARAAHAGPIRLLHRAACAGQYSKIGLTARGFSIAQIGAHVLGQHRYRALGDDGKSGHIQDRLDDDLDMEVRMHAVKPCRYRP